MKKLFFVLLIVSSFAFAVKTVKNSNFGASGPAMGKLIDAFEEVVRDNIKDNQKLLKVLREIESNSNFGSSGPAMGDSSSD